MWERSGIWGHTVVVVQTDFFSLYCFKGSNCLADEYNVLQGRHRIRRGLGSMHSVFMPKTLSQMMATAWRLEMMKDRRPHQENIPTESYVQWRRNSAWGIEAISSYGGMAS